MRGRWAILALCACAACAHALPAPPTPSRPVLVGAEGEPVAHFFARLLVDACTARQTSEELIDAVLDGESRCPEPFGAACNHAACVWLAGEENCSAQHLRHTDRR
jgi:hypothetical protein